MHFSPPLLVVRRHSVYTMALEACCFLFSGSCLRVCIFVSLPNPSEVYVFFSRYLQERLKQLHEEVNLLKSNIAKYKVENPDNAGSDSP